jgi:hypothetical protein
VHSYNGVAAIYACCTIVLAFIIINIYVGIYGCINLLMKKRGRDKDGKRS